MKKLKVYEYAKCSTCKNALKYLDAKKIPYEKLAISETPPTLGELKKMLGYVGTIRKLFNTSGMVYRDMKLSEKLPNLSEEQALQLLASNGMLVKRPFIIAQDGDGKGVVGFKQKEWPKEWG